MSDNDQNIQLPEEEKIESVYNDIDLKYIATYKKMVIDSIISMANGYLKIIRPANDKTLLIDAQAKDQIMYIFCRLLLIASKLDKKMPEEKDSEGTPNRKESSITTWIETNLETSSNNYKIHRFLIGSTQHLKYNMVGEELEEKILDIISKKIEDEDTMQYTVELFILFMKSLASSLANFSWATTKRISSINVNGIIRNMDRNVTNPDIFDEIYEFANFTKKK